MRRILIAVGLVIALSAVPALALASPRHRIDARAARVAHLRRMVASDLPGAAAQVNAARAAGPAAVHALVQRVTSMPMPAPGTTSPEQYALLQALNASGETTGTADPTTSTPIGTDRKTIRSATYCWYVGSHIYSQYHFAEAGIVVARFEKDHDFWCGNSYSITNLGGSNYGFYHKASAQGPWCMVPVFNVNGWDGPHASWAHGGMTEHFGSYTPWTTCATWLSGSVGLRIAADGFWDRYNDF